MTDCENCPGGDDHIHALQPTFAETRITIDGDQVLFPRPLRPHNICVEKLANVDFDADPVEIGAGQMLMAWDAESCKLRRAVLPCPVVVEWDQTSTVGPPEGCLLYTSPSPRDQRGSRMPSSA